MRWGEGIDLLVFLVCCIEVNWVLVVKKIIRVKKCTCLCLEVEFVGIGVGRMWVKSSVSGAIGIEIRLKRIEG